jgi:hypothetical protein
MYKSQAVRLSKWKGTQQQCVDHAKNTCGCADAEGKGKESNDSEGRGFPEHTQGEARVLNNGLQPRKTTRIADGFFGLLKAAEFEEGLAASFVGGHSGPQIVGSVQFEVGGQLFLQFAV